MAYYTVQIYQDDHENGVPCQKWSNVASEFSEEEARQTFDQYKQKIGQGVHIVEIGSDADGLIERVGGYPA